MALAYQHTGNDSEHDVPLILRLIGRDAVHDEGSSEHCRRDDYREAPGDEVA